MNINKNEVFKFSSALNNDQILRTYIECVVKYNTLNWYLYYEDFFNEHTNTSMLNMETPMKASMIDDKSTDDKLDYYFRYLKACHLGVEYIEHSLKLLLMLEGYDIRQIKRFGIEHDLKKHFDLLQDERLKSIIISSIGHYDEKFLNNVLNGIPTNITFLEMSSEQQDRFYEELDLIDKVMNGEQLSLEEEKKYREIEQKMEEYKERKYIKPAQTSNKFFESILTHLKSSFVDLRYPEISENCNYYNLDIILSICKNLSLVLQTKMEESRILDDEKKSIDEYVSQIIADDEQPIVTNTNLEINLIDRPLTAFEDKKNIASNKAKYNAIFYYMYGVEEFFMSGKRDYWASLGDILRTTSLARERVNKKSNDKSIYENYLYYQACHLASDYIEHSLKLLLLDSGKTYKDIKEQYSHDFKSMFYALPIDSQQELKNVVVYFNEAYLDKASVLSPNFRDVIKLSKEEQREIRELWQWADLKVKETAGESLTEEETTFLRKYEEPFLDDKQMESRKRLYEQEHQLKIDKYFDQLLNQISDSFKITRYPDFYNFNLDYKYCLKFLLAFAETLESEIELKKQVSYLPKSNIESLIGKSK